MKFNKKILAKLIIPGIIFLVLILFLLFTTPGMKTVDFVYAKTFKLSGKVEAIEVEENNDYLEGKIKNGLDQRVNKIEIFYSYSYLNYSSNRWDRGTKTETRKIDLSGVLLPGQSKRFRIQGNDPSKLFNTYQYVY